MRSSASGPLPIESDDELGRLTRAFNEMQEQLSRVDRARREFIANASHELRTPIFSLGGFLELLQDEELDDQTRREFVGVVRDPSAVPAPRGVPTSSAAPITDPAAIRDALAAELTDLAARNASARAALAALLGSP